MLLKRSAKLVLGRGELEIIRGVCQAIADITPHIRLAWTWFGPSDTQTIRPQVFAGPALEYAEDTAHFHAEMQRATDAHNPEYYSKFKAWADEYFYIPHRRRARGVGGIFYDDLNTGNWEADFALTQTVGSAFLPAFVPLTQRRCETPWSAQDREAQLLHRGLFAEYNMVYDRGTIFGLDSGHDADAVLMSLPPVAKWH